MKDNINYEFFIRIINTLTKMFRSEDNSFELDKPKLKALSLMMKFQKGEKKAPQIDGYCKNLFKHFCINLKFIRFNMYFMTLRKMAFMNLSRFTMKRYGFIVS